MIRVSVFVYWKCSLSDHLCVVDVDERASEDSSSRTTPTVEEGVWVGMLRKRLNVPYNVC